MCALLVLGGANSAKAEKVYADLSQYSSWNATDKNVTMTWTGTYGNALSPNLNLPTGDLSGFTKLVVETDEINNADFYRILVYNGSDTNHSNTFKVTSTGRMEFSLVGNVDFLDNVTRIVLSGSNWEDSKNGTWTTTPASAKIAKVYLYKPAVLNFNDVGVATISKDDILVSGGLSIEESGDNVIVKTNGQEGYLTVTFATPYDFSPMQSLVVSQSGYDNLFQWMNMEKNDGTNVHNDNAWYSSKYGLTNMGQYASRATDVKQLKWFAPAIAKGDGESDEEYAARLAGCSLTISAITITSNIVSCNTPLEEIEINTLPYFSVTSESAITPEYHVGSATGTYFGNGDTDATRYVDLTDCSEIRIYRDSQTGFRAFFVDESFVKDAIKIVQNHSSVSWVAGENSYWKIDLSKVTKFHNKVYLIAIKSSAWDASDIVKKITVMKTPAGSAKYVLSGNGMMTAAATAALTDVNATYIDATGITAATALPTANPNCLITANSGMVTNANNIIVDGTCANLVLTDGYPFKAPADFTATEASYATTINASAQAGTLCLPFAAAIPVGVEVWTLNYSSGDKAAATPVETVIPANTPVLLNGSGDVTFTGSSVAIDADAVNVSGAMTGVFDAKIVTSGSYVLQNGSEGLGFYKVASPSTIVISPFRAYLTAQSSGANIRIVYDDATAIDEVKTQTAGDDAIYTLTGIRVAQPTKGIYVKNGRKFIVK